MGKKAFDKIAAGMRDAIAIARGEADPATYRVHVPSEVDVKAIRKGMNMSQEEFSGRFGLPVATVRDWEQNRRKPEGPARVLMMVIEKEPDAVWRALTPNEAKIVAQRMRVVGNNAAPVRRASRIGRDVKRARPKTSKRHEVRANG